MNEYDDQANLKTNTETATLIDAGKCDSEIALYLRLGEEVMRFAESTNTTGANILKETLSSASRGGGERYTQRTFEELLVAGSNHLI